MSDENSLINIGDLAKPVDTLVQRVSSFVGAALAPRQLIRMAKAKVDAERIEKLGNVETDIRERALQRLLAEETRNQENIENILRLALPKVKEDAKPNEIEEDWLASFFDKSKRFSDTEMQSLWSKILAGEANKKDSFSKRTIDIVSTFDKNDAQLFTNLCCFGWNIESFCPLIYRVSEPDKTIYKEKYIFFDTLHHLEAIGLIRFQSSFGFAASGLPEIIQTSYFGTQINLEIRTVPPDHLNVGQVLLTKAGKELAPICGSEKVDGFLDFVINEWRKEGCIASSPFPREIRTVN